MKHQKRVVAIHDISCIGKCSLTVALPIISSAGIETSIIPTAVLSTHTGGFTDFTYRDLTDDILKIVNHWTSLHLKYDAIYTGFLGSFEQIDIVSKVFDLLKTKETLILVDPVMADHGELYSIFPKDFPEGMKKLCQKADVLVPNITEAVLLLDEEYLEGPYTKEYIEGLLERLKTLGSKQIVLTGVYFDNENLGVATYDCTTSKVDYAFGPRVGGLYHGTGDVFGSALLSALLNDFNLLESAQIAVNYTIKSIEQTKLADTDPRFGVNFESAIPFLIKSLGL